MNPTKINWYNPKEGWKLDYTLNPIVGCKRNCKDNEGNPYCYAKKLNDRFKWIPEWTEPVFYPNRLKEITKIKEPSTIFIGSMSDILGSWIHDEWINEIITATEENPQHRFMFLTKNPIRYFNFEFPSNCWLGATVDHARHNERIDYLRGQENKTFLSIEPILSDFSKVNFSGIDYLIVGADSSVGAKPPEKKWITGIKHQNIMYKDNVKHLIK